MNMHETIVTWHNDRMNKIVAAILPYASVQISVVALYLSVFAPEFNFRYLRSGLKDYMSKYKERLCIKICITS